MELKVFIISEVNQAPKAKNNIITHMQITDLKQIQQYYWTWVTLREDCTQEG
jgi:hypothetical protein